MQQQSTLVITVDSRQAEKNVKQLDKELVALTTQGEAASNKLGGAFSQLTTYAAGFLTVATAINKIDMFTNMQNRLKLVTTSQKDLTTAMNDTFRIAQNSRQAWDGVVQVYQRFSDNAKNLNINMQQTAQLTETVSKAVAISGASAASAEAALNQFGQSLASGVFRGEEFNSVAEQTPALLKAIASGLGVTIGELRDMAQNGKITSDVLVKALTKARASVDELFSRTDMTIAQSITVLSNEVTKFVGEAGKGGGAADALAGSIKLLAENISLIADVALAAGIGYITKAIITKTVAVEADIAASIASRNAAIAQAQADVAEATAATNAAKAHLANTQATSAETQAKYGATAAATRYTVAQAAVTAATNVQTAAQTRLTAATAIFGRVATGALALVGGPIGVLALAVTGAVFAFNKMSESNEAANKKLLETSKYAQLAADDLNKLEGSQKRAAKDDLQKSFDEKNKRLKELGFQFNATVIDMQNFAKGNAEVAKISNDVRTGVISQSEAIKRLNKLDLFTGEQIQAAEDANQKYREMLPSINADEKALKVFGVTVKYSGNEAENAAYKVDANSSSLNANATAAQKASKAQTDYMASLRQSAIQTGIVNELVSRGYDLDRAKALAEAYVKSGNTINKETVKLVDQNIAQNNKLKATEDAIAESRKKNSKIEKDSAKQAERDQKERLRLLEEEAKAREDIKYKYATRETQIEMDLQEELKKIREAKFSPQDTKGFSDNARYRADLEKQLYTAQLAYELNEWQLTEQEKLDKQVEINSIKIKLDADMNDDMKRQALDSLIDRSAFEADQIDLNKRKRIFDATEFQYSEMDRIKKRGELEREEIAKTNKAEERDALLQASKNKQQIEMNNLLSQTQQKWEAISNAMMGKTNESSISDTRSANIGAAQSLFDQEISLAKTAEEREAIWTAHKKRMQLIENDYYGKSKAYQLQQTSDIFGGLAGLYLNFEGETSKTYAHLVAIQKGANLASVIMNSYAAISAAWASAPFPYNLPAVATTTMQTGVLQAAMQAFTPTGFESGGYTGNMGTKTVAGVVHGQEYVFNAKATKKIGANNLDQFAKTGELPNQQQAQPTTNIINVFDESELRSAMATPAGEKIILNVIKRNRSSLGI